MCALFVLSKVTTQHPFKLGLSREISNERNAWIASSRCTGETGNRIDRMVFG